MLDQILLIGAVIAFLLDAFRVAAAVSWTPLGFALVTASLLL
jgi:hypothetical protein